MSSEAEEEEPHPKKLRFSDPDLTVVLEYTETDDNGGNKDQQQTKEYQMYSQKLASMSKFVDAALTVDMKEKETSTITFHGVTPKEFETAFGYIENPIKVLTMTAQDALKVAAFYDQYEFTGGLAICDEILKAYLIKQPILNERKKTKGYIDNEPDPDLLVDVIAAAYKYNFTQSLEKGIAYLAESFGALPSLTMYTESHLRELHPLFKSGKLKPPFQLTSEEIGSALFPKYFSVWIAQRSAPCSSEPSRISVEGVATPRYVNDCYTRVTDNEYKIGLYGYQYLIEKNPVYGRDWIITAGTDPPETRQILFRSPSSCNSVYPPKWPWIPVEGTGDVLIKYIK